MELMPREHAMHLVKESLPNKNLRKHVYAVEAVMRGLAEHLGEDPEVWGLAGLLHDLDYEKTQDDPDRHTYLTVEWLEQEDGVPGEVKHAIHAHADHAPRESLMDKAIYCADPTTGFLVACALMHPSKKLAQLDPGFIKRRFDEKRFAAGASREQMAACSEIGLELDDFLMMANASMIGIARDLGL